MTRLVKDVSLSEEVKNIYYFATPYYPAFFHLKEERPSKEECIENVKWRLSLMPMFAMTDGESLALSIQMATRLGYEKFGMPRPFPEEDLYSILGVQEFWSDVDKNFTNRGDFLNEFNRASQEFTEKEQSRPIEEVLGIQD